ncbi:mitochondrial outer membrane protein porin 2-like isoform X2 [Triticum dicoccoides]|uniref:mitochondrial outer membrane protein porin 2-like isoform X2 n=1 Tax=Triticum dicoccoides TaxID=85692 RepID=UPI000E7AE221|nr:mitochondrial outer membrane protein porin 2-like isoform X2 [Triticum dicoccoides]
MVESDFGLRPPVRIANTYIEIVKLLPHGGWSAYLLDKYAEKGCSDVCPFTGNGEFSPVPVQKPAVGVQLPAEVDEKHHSEGDKEDAEGGAVQVPAKVNEKHHSEGDKEDAEGGEKQPADGDYACFFHEIGKKAYDLLYQDYNTGLKMVSDSKVLLSDGSEQIGKASLGFELSSDTKLIKLTLDDVLRPGLKGLLSIPVSSQSSSKVDLQYRHLGACITASSELQGSPIVSFSAVIGTESIALGADVSVITKSLDALGAVDSLETKLLRFPKYTCGLVLSEGDVGASFTIARENADVLTATYHQKLDETTSIAAKVQHVLSSNDNSLTVGFSHALDPNTTVKAKLSSDGAVSVLLRYGPKPKCYVAFSADSNPMRLKRIPNLVCVSR